MRSHRHRKPKSLGQIFLRYLFVFLNMGSFLIKITVLQYWNYFIYTKIVSLVILQVECIIYCCVMYSMSKEGGRSQSYQKTWNSLPQYWLRYTVYVNNLFLPRSKYWELVVGLKKKFSTKSAANNWDVINKFCFFNIIFRVFSFNRC